ncbi:JADE2 [Cordylochernes scorpioides]|uniref:JADE2 n=1 Tax=Cordylochernes scorpioides TaxID=51811 RepID=A0ABY6LLU4_9ARAC|nr:JADE2 [Cordylochernes scorpioides]
MCTPDIKPSLSEPAKSEVSSPPRPSKVISLRNRTSKSPLIVKVNGRHNNVVIPNGIKVSQPSVVLDRLPNPEQYRTWTPPVKKRGRPKGSLNKEPRKQQPGLSRRQVKKPVPNKGPVSQEVQPQSISGIPNGTTEVVVTLEKIRDPEDTKVTQNEEPKQLNPSTEINGEREKIEKKGRLPYTKPLPRGRKRKQVLEDEGEVSKKSNKVEVKEIRKGRGKPIELYRKDLISAMKLPDTEVLEPDTYFEMMDPWKKEWESPVQVPVNPSALPLARITETRKLQNWKFRLPKKYLRLEKNKHFNPDLDIVAAAAEIANQVCPYDLDLVDLNWLEIFNEKREEMGMPILYGDTMEQLMYDFECQAEEHLKKARKTEEVMRLAYDENVACDICRKTYTEEGNEIVFCEYCNISVHQYCYGLSKLPQGSWLCHTCVLGIRPSCVLCPNLGGAMKNIEDQHKWVHVSCALWVPEVEISRLNCISSIIKIDQIPESRWALSCYICHIREGACIQCSVKSCKMAYHVTCAYNEKLTMNYSLGQDEENSETFFESYCSKHCRSNKDDLRSMTAQEEKEKRVKELKANFFKYVNLSDTKDSVKMTQEDNEILIKQVFIYWLLKRKSRYNNPLFQFESEESLLNQVKEDNINVRKNTYKSLRSSLEKARNLAYMVVQREKKKKAFIKAKSEIFEKQCEVLAAGGLGKKDTEVVLRANQGISVYDKTTTIQMEPVIPEALIVDYLYGHLRSLKVGMTRKRRPRTSSSTVLLTPPPLLSPIGKPSGKLSPNSASYCSSLYSEDDTSISIASTSSLDSLLREVPPPHHLFPAFHHQLLQPALTTPSDGM